MPRPLTRALLRLAAAGAIGLAATAGYATFRIWQQGTIDEQGHPADAIVVLGAAHYGDEPSAVFAARLDHAVQLWLSGAAPWLVVTGGMAPGDTTAEADVAREYAEDRGVPSGAILAERTGRDTVESLRNVAALLAARNLDTALFVSDRTHMLRVLRIAADLGIRAYGSPTETSPSDQNPLAWGQAALHELGALALYLVTGR
ncbi:MAG: YdcF family protein [Candidatus Limnocylindrales bacterium]